MHSYIVSDPYSLYYGPLFFLLNMSVVGPLVTTQVDEYYHECNIMQKSFGYYEHSNYYAIQHLSTRILNVYRIFHFHLQLEICPILSSLPIRTV